MEWAFRAPSTLQGAPRRRARRRGDRGDGPRGAGRPCSARSRRCTAYPAAMARRVHGCCVSTSSTTTTATPATIWTDARSGDELFAPPARAAGLRRGEVADLHGPPRQALGRGPPGGRSAAGPFADDEPRSVADIDSPPSRWPRCGSGRRSRRPGQGQGRLSRLEPWLTVSALAAVACDRSWRWRSSQPSSTATARGSWRSWWPAPPMIRSSAVAVGVGQHAGVEVRHRTRRRSRACTSSGRGASCPRRRHRPDARAARASRLERRREVAESASRRCRGRAAAAGGGGWPSRRSRPARPGRPRPARRDVGRRRSTHSAPPVPKPGQPDAVDRARWPRRWSTAACRSASQPPSEKSPSESPQPRKRNVSTIQPSRGDAVGQLREARRRRRRASGAPSGKPWQSTRAGAARRAVSDGRARWASRRRPCDTRRGRRGHRTDRWMPPCRSVDGIGGRRRPARPSHPCSAGSRGCGPRRACRGRSDGRSRTSISSSMTSGSVQLSRSCTTWLRLSPTQRWCSKRVGRSMAAHSTRALRLPKRCLAAVRPGRDEGERRSAPFLLTH